MGRLAKAISRHCEVTVTIPRGGEEACRDWEGIQVKGVAYASRAREKSLQGPGGIPAALTHNPLNYLFIPALLWQMFRAARLAARQVDLVHAHWAVCGWLAAGNGRPVVTTFRGADIERAERNRLDRWLLGRAIKGSGRCCTVNTDLKQRAVRLFPDSAEKFSVVPNGVGEAFFELPEVELTDTLRLVAVGSLVPRKGFDVLLEAVSALKGRKWSLEIVGDGAERHALESRIKDSGLSGQVFLRGSMAPDAIPSLLSEADVLVCPSRSEGRPNAVLEAMAAARAVIASDIPGMREIVIENETGLLFASESATDLAARIGDLLDEPDRVIRYGRNGRAAIHALGLSWMGSARAYVDIYKDVLASRTWE